MGGGLLSVWTLQLSRMVVEVGMEQVPTSWRKPIQEICRQREGENNGISFKSAEGSHSLLETHLGEELAAGQLR